MTSWPVSWVAQSLDALGVQSSTETRAILLAWKNSTPLPPLSNNPIGMPAGTAGAPKYLNTEYAIFPSMSAFYSALGKFAQSSRGAELKRSMISTSPYPATWRAISALSWPASKTETDYPAMLLDLTEASYRASIKATDPAERKTSGLVGVNVAANASVVEAARAVAQAANTINGAHAQMMHLLRRST